MLEDLNNYRKTIDSRNDTRLKLDMLGRQLGRLIASAPACSECTELLDKVEAKFNAVQKAATPRNRRKLRQTMTIVSIHLRERHRLYPRGDIQSNWVGLGILIGTIIGLIIFHDFLPGFFIGLTIGVIIGTLREKKAVKQNQVY